VGDVINYEITVTNEGNVTLDVILGDVLFGWVDSAEKELGLLEPGESITVDEGSYTIKQSDLDAGKVINTVTAYGRYNNLENGAKEWVEDSDDETVTGFQDPSISLDKSATHLNDAAMDPVIYNKAGDVITYTFTVENTGNVTLIGVQIDDELTGSEDLEVEPSILKPGDKGTATAKYTITKADVEAGSVNNEATVTGYDPNEEEVSDTDSEIVKAKRIVPPPPPPPDREAGISLIKSADPQTYSEAGEKITYTFTVENTGEVKLTDITITEDTFSGSGELPDPEFDRSSQDSAEGTLVAGESATYIAVYSVTQADVDTSFIENAATVTGYDPNKNPVTDSDDERVTARQTPAIRLVKSASPKTYTAAGQVITYTFTVTNNGNVTLTDVKIDDDKLAISGLVVEPPTLAPDQKGTATATYTITAEDVTANSVVNTAKATGKTPEDKAITDTDRETVTYVTTVAPSISVIKQVSVDGGLTWYDAKTARGPNVLIDSKVQFKFIIKNTGNVTLTGLTLTDDTYSLSGATVPASLAPGKSFEYILDNVKAKAGQHSNTATATGRYEKQTFRDTDKAHYYGYEPDKPPSPKPVPTPPTGGDTMTALIIALFLLIFASIGLRKALQFGLAGRTGKKF